MIYDNNDDLEKGFDPTQIGRSSKEYPLKGISGLLALLACMLMASICMEISSVLDLFKSRTFHVLLFIAHSLSFLINVFLLMLMFKKVYFFATVAFWFILISGIVSVIPVLILRIDILTAFIVVKTAAWCVYLKRSERVRRTFVCTWQGKEIDNEDATDSKEEAL